MALARPRDLVFTLFGEYLLHRPGAVWVGSILELLEPLGVSASSARTTLSRMSREGWFTTDRRGRRSYYELSDKGRRLLREGEERIHHPPWDRPWDGRWLLVAYSVPEEERTLRDRFRDRLLWLGFGSLGNGLWISPHAVADRVREAAEALGLAEHTEVFRADHLAFSDAGRLVERCWDLAEINGRYQDFIERHLPAYQGVRRALDGAGRSDPADAVDARNCYVRRFRLVHEYREFPLIDPFLPRALLPEGWAGECASVFFESYHDLLSEPANAWVDRTVEIPEAGPGAT